MSSAVDVWYARVGETLSAKCLRGCTDCLSDEERSRSVRFRAERDRRLFLAAHALVRMTLSRHAAVVPGAWQFKLNPHGRPEVSGPPGHTAVHFSLSHTEGLVVVAVCRDGEVGVDVEALGRRPAQPGLAERYFSAAEAAALAEEPRELRHRAFLEIWTLKEAYAKARGLGLSLPLDSFTVTRQPDRPTLAFAPLAGDHPDRWHLIQRQPTPEHLIAVAVRPAAVGDPVVTFRETAPDEWF